MAYQPPGKDGAPRKYAGMSDVKYLQVGQYETESKTIKRIYAAEDNSIYRLLA
jgi:hypothetical protein